MPREPLVDREPDGQGDPKTPGAMWPTEGISRGGVTSRAGEGTAWGVRVRTDALTAGQEAGSSSLKDRRAQGTDRCQTGDLGKPRWGLWQGSRDSGHTPGRGETLAHHPLAPAGESTGRLRQWTRTTK